MCDKVRVESLQLWPSGRCLSVRFKGDKVLSVKGELGHSPNRFTRANKDTERAVKIEKAATLIRDREIYCCDSSLVSDMMQAGNDEFSLENVSNLRTDPDGWAAETCEEWLRDRDIEFDPIGADDECEYEERLRDLVRDNAEESEPYEWWRCSEWLARQLNKVGECVLDNNYGYWWGRGCTGQSMMMDGTLQKVAALMVDNYHW